MKQHILVLQDQIHQMQTKVISGELEVDIFSTLIFEVLTP